MEKIAKHVIDTPLPDALKERYLSYALSTILSRSLPDVRDGLKPVHRRILFAMRQLKLDPKTMHKKSARVVGDVIGKFHPHGESAIYESLVRLAQDFSVRYPLVDGQGNFGTVDGDSAAAMRYTEARLTPTAEWILTGLDEETVDFKRTYDGESLEPIVLPGAFPNLLANGASGIAVGMATNIPPHNASELYDALSALLDNPQLETKEILSIVNGPDFPTGGILIETQETLKDIYESGRGSLRVRAKWEIETLKNDLYQIVITEIPYQVQKSKLIEQLADLILEKKLPILGDVRDESTDVIRIILEPKTRTIEPQTLMEALFKMSALESRFSMNLNVVDDRGVPGVMSLKGALQAFLSHQFVILQRRSGFRLRQIEKRLEVLHGYHIAFLNLDEVIHIIREEDDPAAEFKKRWNLTDNQCESILNMRLRSLRRLEEFAIQKELSDLSTEKDGLQGLLSSPQEQKKQLKKTFAQQKKILDTNPSLAARRTSQQAPVKVEAWTPEDSIEKEAITILCSLKGWIRAAKGHGENWEETKYKEGDESRFQVACWTTDRLLILTERGRCFTLAAHKITRGRGQSDPIRHFFDMETKDDIVYMAPYRGDTHRLLLINQKGRGFFVEEGNTSAQTRAGKQVFHLSDDENLSFCFAMDPEQQNTANHIALVGTSRKMLIFSLEEIPTLQKGRGVTLQKYKDGDLLDATLFKKEIGLRWGNSALRTDLSGWIGRRGQSGRMVPWGFPRTPCPFTPTKK